MIVPLSVLGVQFTSDYLAKYYVNERYSRTEIGYECKQAFALSDSGGKWYITCFDETHGQRS